MSRGLRIQVALGDEKMAECGDVLPVPAERLFPAIIREGEMVEGAKVHYELAFLLGPLQAYSKI